MCFLFLYFFLMLLLKKKVMWVYFLVFEICSWVLLCFVSYLFNMLINFFGGYVIGVFRLVEYLVNIINVDNLGVIVLVKLLKFGLRKIWLI